VVRRFAFVLWVVGLGLVSPGGRASGEGAEEAAAPVTSSVEFRALDLDGALRTVGMGHGARASAVVFLATECPISNRAVTTLNALARDVRGEVDVLGVLSDPTLSRAKAKEWTKQYALEFPVLFDASGDLARRLAPSHTPEAFLIARDGALVYRGRIDDAYLELGKPQARVTRRDLADAVAACMSGTPAPVARTSPVGCAFEAWTVKATTSAPQVTFARDVAPILYTHCADCHHPGAIGPFSLLTYEDAAKRARTIAQVTTSRYMPPWRAAPGFGHFADERRLSDREIEVLAEWARLQAPLGDPKELPPTPVFSSSWALGEPDLVVPMPHEFEVPASGPDIYRCFVLEQKIPDDSYVVAVDFRPGAPTVVHHCLVFLDTSGAARRLEKDAGGNGYPAFGGPHFVPAGSLSGWAPGAQPALLPSGCGRPVKKDMDIVIQMHYHPNGKVEHDRSTLALYFAKKPIEKVVGWVPLWNENIDILPDEAHYTRHAGLTLPMDVTVIGIVPHMHLIGHEMKVVAKTPEGETIPLIWIPDWAFRWQGQYTYSTPLHLKKGTRISLEAIYDNSSANAQNPNDPPQEVTFGEQTTDEMCLCFLTLAVDGLEDLRTVRRALSQEKREPARPPKKVWR
jgi:mono/diheme cytochrome c family protein